MLKIGLKTDRHSRPAIEADVDLNIFTKFETEKFFLHNRDTLIGGEIPRYAVGRTATKSNRDNVLA